MKTLAAAGLKWFLELFYEINQALSEGLVGDWNGLTGVVVVRRNLAFVGIVKGKADM